MYGTSPSDAVVDGVAVKVAVALAEKVDRADDVRVTVRLLDAELVAVPEYERDRVDDIEGDPTDDTEALSVIPDVDVPTTCVKLHVRPAVCVPVIVVVPDTEGDSRRDTDADFEKLGDVENKSVEDGTSVGNGECESLLLAASDVVRVGEKNAEELDDCDARADADGIVRVARGEELSETLAVKDLDDNADDESMGDRVGVDAAESEGASATDGFTPVETVDDISELKLGEGEALFEVDAEAEKLLLRDTPDERDHVGDDVAPERLAVGVLLKCAVAVKLRTAIRVAETDTVAQVVCVMRIGLALGVRLTTELGLELTEPESDRVCDDDGDADPVFALDIVGFTVPLGEKLTVSHEDVLIDPEIDTTGDAVNESDVVLVTDEVLPGESVPPIVCDGVADVDCVAHSVTVGETVGEPRAVRDAVALIVDDEVLRGLAESERLIDALGVADADREPDTEPLVERDANGEFDANDETEALGDVDGDCVNETEIADVSLTVTLVDSERDAAMETVSVADLFGVAVVEGDAVCVGDRRPDGDADADGVTVFERLTDGERDGDAVLDGDGRVDGDSEGDAVNDNDGGGDAETETESELNGDDDAHEDADEETTAEGDAFDVRVFVCADAVVTNASMHKIVRIPREG